METYRGIEDGYLEIPFTFSWKIENFSMGMLFRNDWLCSSPFTLPYTNTSWKIMLYPNFVFTKDKYISIYLHWMPNKKLRESHEYEISLSVVSIDGSDKKCIWYRESFENLDYWGSQKFISWNLLLKEKETLFPKDTLTIHCMIKRYVRNFQYVFSVLNCFNRLFDKEKRYPPEFTSVNKQASGTDGLLPNKHYKLPVLHKWFEYLYSEKLYHFSFSDLQTIIVKAIVEKSCKFPNGMPERWILNSKLKAEKASFTWYIKEFSRLKRDEKFFSPAFKCGSSDWKLLFYLSEDDTRSGIAEIFICPMSLYLSAKKIIKCKISVINRDGRLPLSQESIHLYDGNGHWRFPPFIQVKVISNNRESYLVNDVLCLFCTFSVSEGKYESRQSWKGMDYDEEFHSQYISLSGVLQMREDILYLFESGLYSDMTVKVGQTEIPVHKEILSGRSSYFKYWIKAFKKVKGGNKTTIEITDLTEETVRKLLKIIYSGKYECCDEDVMIAASKYGVNEKAMEENIENINPSFCE